MRHDNAPMESFWGALKNDPDCNGFDDLLHILKLFGLRLWAVKSIESREKKESYKTNIDTESEMNYFSMV
jgi:hypothetical protein